MTSRPANCGKKWTDEETLEVLKAIRRKETIALIAKNHQRTHGGIHAKLKELAADYYYNEEKSIEDIEKFTGLSKDNIADAISRRQLEMDEKEKKLHIQKVDRKPMLIDDSEPKIFAAGAGDGAAHIQQPEIKKEGMISILTEIREMMREMLEIMKAQNQ